MHFYAHRTVIIAALIAVTTVGCNAIPRIPHINDDDPRARRWTAEWYETEHFDSPLGARQKYKAARLWPPFPRPTGRQQEFSQRFHAAHYWPHPYVCQDRAYVHNLVALQAKNGWMESTTILDQHFDEMNTLNQPGRQHLRWILQNVPEQHRVAWVQTAASPEASQERLVSVQTSVTEMIGEGNAPPVMLRIANAHGRPALEIDAIRRSEISSMPEPRVAYEALPTGAGE